MIVSLLSYSMLLYRDLNIAGTVLSYIYPGVIWASLAMVIISSKIKLGSIKWLNWISSSVFAVYIIHQSPFLAKQYFKPMVNCIYDNEYGIEALINIMIFLVIVFMVSILIDQPRKYLWEKISKFL